MQNKSKQSHSSTNFYLVVTILIVAICLSIGYAVNRYHVLQQMIAKNHIPDSPFLRFLAEAEKYFAPVTKHLEPFQSAISILFTIVLFEFLGQIVSVFVPKKIKNSIKDKQNKLLRKIKTRIKYSIKQLRKSRK